MTVSVLFHAAGCGGKWTSQTPDALTGPLTLEPPPPLRLTVTVLASERPQTEVISPRCSTAPPWNMSLIARPWVGGGGPGVGGAGPGGPGAGAGPKKPNPVQSFEGKGVFASELFLRMQTGPGSPPRARTSKATHSGAASEQAAQQAAGSVISVSYW